MSARVLKPGWRMVALGEVARAISKRVESPADSEYDRFVGLEHFKTGELKIRAWGGTANLVSAGKIFSSGDTLFARRNAYLKRASMVDFDGVCSGDAIVLRALPQDLITGFLPLILNTDDFWEYALANAAGSMSKRVNVKCLMEYEFPLPPLGEQKRIVEQLWAADKAEEQYGICAGMMTHIRHRFFFEQCMAKKSQTELNGMTRIREKKWLVKNLSELIAVSAEKSSQPHKFDEYLALEHLATGLFRASRAGDSDSVKGICTVYHPGDILYGKLRPNLDKAVAAEGDGVCSTEILVLGGINGLSNELLLHHLHFPAFVAWNAHRAFGTKMPRTSLDIIGSYKIPVPPADEQARLVATLNEFVAQEDALMKHQSLIRAARDRLLDHFLWGGGA